MVALDELHQPLVFAARQVGILRVVLEHLVCQSFVTMSFNVSLLPNVLSEEIEKDEPHHGHSHQHNNPGHRLSRRPVLQYHDRCRHRDKEGVQE